MIGVNIGKLFNPTKEGIIKSSTIPSSLLTGLVAYYKFDETSGSSVSDSSGNGNTGTWNGTLGSQWAAGKINNGGVFNGTDNYVDVGTGISVQAQNKISVAAWVFYNDFNDYHDIFTSQGGSAYYLQTLVAGDVGAGHIRWTVNAGANLNSTGAFSSGAWHHVVGTFDGTNHLLYMDGSQDATTVSEADTITDSGVNKYIGAFHTTSFIQFMSGKIDELGVWNRALSSAEVTTLYNSGAGKQYPF